MNFVTKGPVITNTITNLDGSVSTITSQATAYSIPAYLILTGAVLVGWLVWALVRPLFDRE